MAPYDGGPGRPASRLSGGFAYSAVGGRASDEPRWSAGRSTDSGFFEVAENWEAFFMLLFSQYFASQEWERECLRTSSFGEKYGVI